MPPRLSGGPPLTSPTSLASLLTLVVLLAVSAVHCGPRYSSRIVEIQSGAIRGIILELNSRHLEPVELRSDKPDCCWDVNKSPRRKFRD
ncbi:unnamed protein product [Acanthoscelides obtectus]|uniref:Uncharacterized protein n=1 Tax=Acanthoscelides obtectus TaxID=200917 RepID=A0A9P0K1W5_ACAOB|nr:unnamed protein product [Acanthoscelides obtectus]CAK1665909.1 hypothetical protein AOBTE_LOCUS25040 [Acanthoscelides obtectus]